jgi:hypothetical protein
MFPPDAAKPAVHYNRPGCIILGASAICIVNEVSREAAGHE